MKKENVYEKTAGAEETATAEQKGKDALAALGKFKDVNALAQAYSQLQAEFTRRSQRLKELERESENSSVTDERARGTDSVTEKLKRKADDARKEEREFNSFVADLESANVRAEEEEKEEPVSPEPANGAEVLTSKRAEEEESVDGQGEFVANGRDRVELSSDDVYAMAVKDERVRLKIIGEYLSSVGKGTAPLLKGGASGLVTPPLRAKTVAEAGNMTLRFLKNKREQ